MFNRKKKEGNKKQYSVSNDDISDVSRLVNAKWHASETFKHTYQGFAKDQQVLMDNIVAKLGIDTTKYDVDWNTLFKDGKIYTHEKPKEEVKKEEAKVEENTPASE